MQYAINENKEEARQIFLQAGEMLSNSVKDVALMAVSGKKIAEVAAVAVHNLFDDNDNNNSASLFARIWKWWNKDKIIAEKREEFYVTLYNICKKLGKYQPLIGESMLINGMIERYTPAICDYVSEKALEQNELEDWQDQLDVIESNRQMQIETVDLLINSNSNMGVRWETLGHIGIGALIAMILSLIVGLFRWIVKVIAGTNVDGWFVTQMHWTLGLIGIAVVIFFTIEIIHIIYCRSILAKRLIQNRDNEIKNVNNEYDARRNELQQQVESVTAEAQSIAQELQQIAELYNEI